MKRFLAPGVVFVLCAVLLFQGAYGYLWGTMPPYRDSIGNETHTEKITGLYLVKEAAARGDNLMIYGSSELRTTEVSTHPANFFEGKRAGFQVNLVGRGSCQSLIHAISIGATGDSLTGQKVVLITSPQSYVPEGIAPDLFMANFSPQQYLELLEDPALSPTVKEYISGRVLELLQEYDAMPNGTGASPDIRYLAEYGRGQSLAASVRYGALRPYYALSRRLYDMKDLASARALLQAPAETPAPVGAGDIDWEREEAAALAQARAMTSNNGFGMLDDYYTTYIGTRLSRQEGKDAQLDYSVSREYDDLRVLFEICRQKGIEPLFIHVPLHGQWSDYTGFSAQRRQAYYGNVRAVVEEYGVAMLDLTGMEYEEYAMCDTMHLGWKGWLEVDKALISYYYGG